MINRALFSLALFDSSLIVLKYCFGKMNTKKVDARQNTMNSIIIDNNMICKDLSYPFIDL